MRVAVVTSEVVPFSKTGGLADVSRALPRELAQTGHRVTVFTPYYKSCQDWFNQHGPESEYRELPYGVWIGSDELPLRYISMEAAGVEYVFVISPELFLRDHLYLEHGKHDYPDNVSRFSFFSRAVLEYALSRGIEYDVFHANDWQSALVPVYLKTLYDRPQLQTARSLLTIHNLGYQGLFPKEQIFATGLGWEHFNAEELEFYDNLNLLKGGIVFADAVNTVSPHYASEIQTPEYGAGLDGVLRAHRSKLSGILNGIDNSLWDPQSDQHTPDKFSAESLAGKRNCKKLLQREFGLPLRTSSLLLGVISRLDVQKGIDLIIDAFKRVAELDIQLVLLGSGSPLLEEQLMELARSYTGQIGLQLGFNEPLAHRIIAGADAFLMPSRYEPCGLTQMYAHRYGTVPIVHETGGLKDTVTNYTPKRLKKHTASGFTFRVTEGRKLADAIRRAAKLYFTERRKWNKLQRSIMALDHSWQASAAQYTALYEALSGARAPQGEEK
jgi:starch synthase